jgi:CubicO group peptidase (beta-lactamase class C family)
MQSFRLLFLLMSSIAAISCATKPPREAASLDAPMDLCVWSQATMQEQLPVDRAELEELIDRVFGANGSNRPGAAVMVMHDGRVIAQRQYGMASLELGVPFTPNHVVRLPYSEGREFIAIAAMFMEHDGLIRLDDPVRGYFPRLPA